MMCRPLIGRCLPQVPGNLRIAAVSLFKAPGSCRASTKREFERTRRALRIEKDEKDEKDEMDEG